MLGLILAAPKILLKRVPRFPLFGEESNGEEEVFKSLFMLSLRLKEVLFVDTCLSIRLRLSRFFACRDSQFEEDVLERLSVSELKVGR